MYMLLSLQLYIILYSYNTFHTFKNVHCVLLTYHNLFFPHIFDEIHCNSRHVLRNGLNELDFIKTAELAHLLR